MFFLRPSLFGGSSGPNQQGMYGQRAQGQQVGRQAQPNQNANRGRQQPAQQPAAAAQQPPPGGFQPFQGQGNRLG